MAGEMSGKKAPVVTAVYEPDEDGWWSVTIPEVLGVRSAGRTIAEARRRAREALALADDQGWDEKRAKAAEVVDDVRLPDRVKRALGARAKALNSLADAARMVERTTEDAVRVLTGDFGRSLRDAAALLELSHGRVHQIVLGGSTGAARTDRRAAARRATRSGGKAGGGGRG